MKLSYDPTFNIAYIRFREKKEQVDSVKLSEELIIDIAADGKLYGIELLNASEQLLTQDLGKLLIVNEKSGEKLEMNLS